jgi:hypothetical protein
MQRTIMELTIGVVIALGNIRGRSQRDRSRRCWLQVGGLALLALERKYKEYRS